MEEKKRTDQVVAKNAINAEKIIRTLECCINSNGADCENCPYNNSDDCLTRSGEDILDFIHSLQSENDKPKSKKILANRVYSDETLKKWKKEDLIEQIRILEHNWAAAEEALNNSAKNSEKLLAEQKAEIERLTKERNEYKDLYETMYCKWSDLSTKDLNCEKSRELVREYLAKNAELQKQVDEYKNKIEQGTLIELPCKVGDTVYCIIKVESGFAMIKDECSGFMISDGEVFVLLPTYGNCASKYYLTREEAEKRLKELQE